MAKKNNDPFKDAITIAGTEKAERYSTFLKNELRHVETEEDVRLATHTFLKSLTQEMGVNVKILSEKIVLTGGRIDSLFDNIIFEFKKPNYFDTQKGIDEAIDGRKQEGGLIEYLISVAVMESASLEDFRKHLSTKIGIGFDGKSFVFVRYVSNANSEIELKKYKSRIKNAQAPQWFPERLDGYFERTQRRDIKNGLRFLFLYLRSISPRAPLTPANVSSRFGERSTHFNKHIAIIYNLLSDKLKSKDAHTTTLFDEWDRVFGKVYGDINDAASDVKTQMNERYAQIGFADKKVDLKYLIFSIHTYYNIILKLLISNLFSSLLNPFQIRSTALAKNDEQFREQVVNAIQGDKFKMLGVENFFETGFFEWWTYVWNENLSEMLREVIYLLEQLEVTTSITKPELIGDMVRETYHGLMPQPLRHLLGEYFTPDWLAEFTIETACFTGKMEETFLDPACGSGTFLATAIRKKLLTNINSDRKELIKDILKSIVGFDLNPISVIASKTNYLLSLGDLSDLDFTVKIPVYQCDSILTPTVHATQKKTASIFTIDTVCGKFSVPALDTREEIEEILDLIGKAIKNNYTDADVLRKVNKLQKDINKESVLALFARIKELTKLDKNGLWIPILKNSFAPVYSEGQFDFVVGNPPWVSWRSMSKSYRDLTLPIWLSYDIFDKSAYDKITTHDDFAMAFTYVSADHYLKPKGKLCFVISQTFFQSKKGGEGFRKFEITRDNQSVPLKVSKLIDMIKVKPFSEVTNRPSVLLLEKGLKTSYPVPYIKWDTEKRLNETDTLIEVKRKITEEKLLATPIGGTDTKKGLRSPWLILPVGRIEILGKAIGASPYKGRKGVEPLGAKGVYLLKEPKRMGKTRLQICNLLERGRLPAVEERGEHVGLVEDEFVFPLISGRNIDRYGLNSTTYIIMPHENKKGVQNEIAEDILRVNYTATYEWLSYFKKVLKETRKRNSKFYTDERPFYFLDNVGTYTFAPYKVVWKEQGKNMISCVVSTKHDGVLKGKQIIPDSKVLFCALDDKEEAYYLCAILNSKPITDLIEGYTINLQRGTDILENVKIPKYDSKDKLHVSLSSLSERAHDLYLQGGSGIPVIQNKIDNTVLDLW
ncbi:MAG: N-6 DNA methylase [Sedimentisphaerales bacterium]